MENPLEPVKELLETKQKCDQIFAKYGIKDFNELEKRLNKGETLADIRYVFIGGRDCGKNEKIRIANKIKAFDTILECVDLDIAIRWGTDQPMLMIKSKKPKDYFYIEVPISKEKYDLFKEVLPNE